MQKQDSTTSGYARAARVAAALFGLLIGLGAAQAQWGYDPYWQEPAGYYDSAQGLSGEGLKSELHNIIDGHAIVSYGDAVNVLNVTDADPASWDSRWNMYWDQYTVYDNRTDRTSTNREHLWPASRQQTSSPRNELGADYSDLFNLRLCAVNVNSDRSNLNYGGQSRAPSYRYDDTRQTGFGSSGGYWYPGDEHRGDVARAMFYMAVRYDGSDSHTVDLEIVDGNPGSWSGLLGNLEKLLEWHAADPVDNAERRRNSIIYDGRYVDGDGDVRYTSFAQGNRNPFIDRPQWVYSIWGGGEQGADTQVSFLDPPQGDGASSATVHVGRVMRLADPPAQSVTLYKSGSQQTSYEVTAGPDVTVTPSGVQEFEGGEQSVGLQIDIDTSRYGRIVSQVTVDNRASTSAGPGLGSDDADDVVDVYAEVLVKRQVYLEPLFSTFDLGTVIVGGEVCGTAELRTTGQDFERTRVDVALAGDLDAEGVRIVSGTGQRFDGGSDAGYREFGGSFSSAGSKEGHVELEVVTAENGGAGLVGEGSYAPVEIAYQAVVLDHAEASLSACADVDTMLIDLGDHFLNDTPVTESFTVSNLEGLSGYTAQLEIDDVQGVGEIDHLTTNAVQTVIEAGGEKTFLAQLDRTQAGSFLATWTLLNSDEDLPGAASGAPLVVELVGRVAQVGDGNFDGELSGADIDLAFAARGNESLLYDLTGDGTVDDADVDRLVRDVFGTEYGDASLDGQVSLADLSALAGNWNQAGGWSEGDFNGDGVITLADLSALAGEWGWTRGAGQAVVPEPASLAMAAMGMLVLAVRRRTRRANQDHTSG